MKKLLLLICMAVLVACGKEEYRASIYLDVSEESTSKAIFDRSTLKITWEEGDYLYVRVIVEPDLYSNTQSGIVESDGRPRFVKEGRMVYQGGEWALFEKTESGLIEISCFNVSVPSLDYLVSVLVYYENKEDISFMITERVRFKEGPIEIQIPIKTEFEDPDKHTWAEDEIPESPWRETAETNPFYTGTSVFHIVVTNEAGEDLLSPDRPNNLYEGLTIVGEDVEAQPYYWLSLRVIMGGDKKNVLVVTDELEYDKNYVFYWPDKSIDVFVPSREFSADGKYYRRYYILNGVKQYSDWFFLTK